MSSNTEIAQKFFAASASGDVEAMTALCSETIQVRQNSGEVMGRSSVTGLAKAVRRVMPDFRYENPVRRDTGVGFVEEHDVCGTLPDGTALRVAVCVVAIVEGGLITSMHEYLDSGEAAPLFAALSRPRT